MMSNLRTTFGLILTIIVATALTLFITPESNKYKYRIAIPHGPDYYTNSYILNSNCITFKNECGCKDEKTVTVCGNYTIITR